MKKIIWAVVIVLILSGIIYIVRGLLHMFSAVA